VTLALAFAIERMTKENLLVRVLRSFETMANASVVATDKTGRLTLNEMTIVAGSVAVHAKFVRRLKENAAHTNVNNSSWRHVQDFSLAQSQLNTVLRSELRTRIRRRVRRGSWVVRQKQRS
jgi:Ca2+-transporting ATPase